MKIVLVMEPVKRFSRDWWRDLWWNLVGWPIFCLRNHGPWCSDPRCRTPKCRHRAYR